MSGIKSKFLCAVQTFRSSGTMDVRIIQYTEGKAVEKVLEYAVCSLIIIFLCYILHIVARITGYQVK